MASYVPVNLSGTGSIGCANEMTGLVGSELTVIGFHFLLGVAALSDLVLKASVGDRNRFIPLLTGSGTPGSVEVGAGEGERRVLAAD